MAATDVDDHLRRSGVHQSRGRDLVSIQEAALELSRQRSSHAIADRDIPPDEMAYHRIEFLLYARARLGAECGCRLGDRAGCGHCRSFPLDGKRHPPDQR